MKIVAVKEDFKEFELEGLNEDFINILNKKSESQIAIEFSENSKSEINIEVEKFTIEEEPETPKTPIKTILTKKVLQNYEKLNNIISNPIYLKKNKVQIPKFKDFIYICKKDRKKLHFIRFIENFIKISSPYNNTLKYKFLLTQIEAVNVSKRNRHLIKICYKDNKNPEKTYNFILECSHVYEFVSALKLNANFPTKVLSYVEYLDIENNQFFNLSSINIFLEYSYCGFVKLWVDNIFWDWKIYFFVIIGGALLRFSLPSTFMYSKCKDIFKNIVIYRLENFTVMKSKRHFKVPNLFALKLINENIDLIIATPSSRHLKGWLETLYCLFDDL